MYDKGFKEAAIRLYAKRKSVKKVAEDLGCAPSTVWRWLQPSSSKPKTRPKKKITVEMLDHLKHYMSSNPAHTLQDAQQELINLLGIPKISRQCVATALRILGFSRKRLRLRGFSQKPMSRDYICFFKDRFCHHLVNKNIVAIDEVGFDHRMLPIFGYSPKGMHAIAKIKSSQRKRLNMIMAIDSSGKHYNEMTYESIKASSFSNFIRNLPWPPGTCILMDNASIHRTTETTKALETKGFSVLYTPPYTPECNPIENVFSVIKHRFRKTIYSNKDVQKHNPIVSYIVENIEKTLFANCFRNTTNFLEKIDIKMSLIDDPI